MSLLFRAATALVFTALISGHLRVLGPHWRVVAADLRQAQPEGRLRAEAFALFRWQKG